MVEDQAGDSDIIQSNDASVSVSASGGSPPALTTRSRAASAGDGGRVAGGQRNRPRRRGAQRHAVGEEGARLVRVVALLLPHVFEVRRLPPAAARREQRERAERAER